MKRNILAMFLVASCSMAALAWDTDGQTYETVSGLNIVNVWTFDRMHTGKAYTDHAICNTKARTATMLDGVIYVSRSEEKAVTLDEDSDPVLQAVIHRFTVEDGTPLPDLDLTLDGAPLYGLLAAASIGRDDFGHLWVAPTTSDAKETVPVYMVDTATGALTLVTEMSKGGYPQRTDYLDVMGDLTLEQAECNIMTISGSNALPGFNAVYRWHGDQGGTWEGGFDDDPYIYILDFFPADKTGFALAPVVKMTYGLGDDDRYSGDLFYIDCNDASPVLYDVNGQIVDTFEEVDSTLVPAPRCNGLAEFKLDGRNFLAYAFTDMNDGGTCQAQICALDENQTLASMTPCWTLPANGLGDINDGGLRVHCLVVDVNIENGEEVATLLTFKSYNGMAVYKIGKNVKPAQPGVKGDLDGNSVVDVDDLNAIINMMLGKAEKTPAADINDDGNVDVDDMNQIINIMLGKNND
ncbi:MAG: hypothetical protein IJT30_10920 [Muribaculaceae bacterium]|nr:hypothetical protein [Muribaculaceae bacterium]